MNTPDLIEILVSKASDSEYRRGVLRYSLEIELQGIRENIDFAQNDEPAVLAAIQRVENEMRDMRDLRISSVVQQKAQEALTKEFLQMRHACALLFQSL